ncbi:transcription termination factor NusA [Parvimonas micra ATCC 33270]|uniref:Transcription termination/antitermination protein NusA n=2 Tax=Parvimonas micra TaxID=33033 RepID=A8SMZ8_9FIRM|nr:transcription termination factor NusA [Parvimonas micra ATCC 33270]
MKFKEKMMKGTTDFLRALDEIEREKGVSKEIIFDSLEKALLKSYEKNFGEYENVKININRTTGKVELFAIKTVVEVVEDNITEISLDDAKAISTKYSLGDEVSIKLKTMDFGRVAAQTARNIVIQKIKDAEREVIYNDFQDKERELISGQIQRIDRNNLFINLGKLEAIVTPPEQIKSEVYRVGERLKFYVKEVKNTPKGAQVLLSRSDVNFVLKLFELEVPEILDGTVEIQSIAREPGSRTKIAVFSKNDDVDPVGACVGYKRSRVSSIIKELKGEKIDIIVYSKNVKEYLSNSLSPSEVIAVFTNESENRARIIVPDSQLSLAIGKEGQNARLAAKLTNWRIDIKGLEKYKEDIENGLIEVGFDGEHEFIDNGFEL